MHSLRVMRHPRLSLSLFGCLLLLIGCEGVTPTPSLPPTASVVPTEEPFVTSTPLPPETPYPTQVLPTAYPFATPTPEFACGVSGLEAARVTATSGLNLRTGPATTNPVIKIMPYETIVGVVRFMDQWAELILLDTCQHGYAVTLYLEPLE